MSSTLSQTDQSNKILEFSGYGFLNLESFELYGNLKDVDLAINATVIFDFRLHDFYVLLYSGIVDLNTSITDNNELSMIFGVSIVDLKTGLLSPIRILKKEIQERIDHIIDEYKEFSQHILGDFSFDLVLAMKKDLDKSKKKLYKMERERFLKRNGISSFFLKMENRKK